jgi:hypothetical protein
MKPRILYAGDSNLASAAGYLAGLLAYHKLPFDYVPGDEPIRARLASAEHTLYIISDYPVKNFTGADFARLLSGVGGGAGLLMIGGWESFRGLSGGYCGSPLAEVLPVDIQPEDDRVNSAQPCLIEKLRDHAILDGLPFDKPPGIGGYNRVRAKPGATTILGARQFEVHASRGGTYTFTKGEAAPLLVLGSFGNGRAAAFTSDVAPHWVGGFVDWGDRRIAACAPGADAIEVGNWYSEFFARLVRWTAGLLQ